MLLAPPAYAQVDAKLSPNVDSLDGTAQRIRAENCREAACQATILIDQAVKLQIAGASATVGRPRPLPRDRDTRVGESYRRLVTEARRVAPELCRQAARLLSGYGAQGVASEVIVPVAVLDLTSRLDRGGADRGCTRVVIRAMPATSAADIAIHNARALCAAHGGAGRCADMAR